MTTRRPGTRGTLAPTLTSCHSSPHWPPHPFCPHRALWGEPERQCDDQACAGRRLVFVPLFDRVWHVASAHEQPLVAVLLVGLTKIDPNRQHVRASRLTLADPVGGGADVVGASGRLHRIDRHTQAGTARSGRGIELAASRSRRSGLRRLSPTSLTNGRRMAMLIVDEAHYAKNPATKRSPGKKSSCIM